MVILPEQKKRLLATQHAAHAVTENKQDRQHTYWQQLSHQR